MEFSQHPHIRCRVEPVFTLIKASRNGKRDLRTTELIFSLSCKTVLLAAISPEINVDDCLINEWMLTMFAVPSVWLYRKNFQRILQKQGMKFKLNTMVTSKLMSHRTFIVWENYSLFEWMGRKISFNKSSSQRKTCIRREVDQLECKHASWHLQAWTRVYRQTAPTKQGWK